MKLSYSYGVKLAEKAPSDSSQQDILVRRSSPDNPELAVSILIQTLKLAEHLGATKHESLLAPTMVFSSLVNQNVFLLKGWSSFDSCVKGFNSLGLMASHIYRNFLSLEKLSKSEQTALKKEFLETRNLLGKKTPAFTPTEIATLSEDELHKVSLYDVAIWRSFAKRPIICSTSSNMGISCHQALRLMQQRQVKFADKVFAVLNQDEGKLVIWAPDKRADFMNPEKTFFLDKIQAEKPALTEIKTYINRQERDPGALKDALLSGGYFFPTNPQSKSEIQNLIFIATQTLQSELGMSFEEVTQNPKMRQTLESIDCSIENGKIAVKRNLEDGIYGLMTPYFLMVEELLSKKTVTAVSTWNQASIGAALAAAVLADQLLKSFTELPSSSQKEFSQYFPRSAKFFLAPEGATSLQTRIHGLFDLANVQSLAQLLGVVVKNHLSGRGTAYVGLGSSSYSNGNRCFEILKKSMRHKDAFLGKKTFHPATHTLNPFAQALIYGEAVWQTLSTFENFETSPSSATLSLLKKNVKKPEPAGAAAVAGYLLTRLDQRSLSIVEVAYAMRLLGFSQKSFLQFLNYQQLDDGRNEFVQKAFEEGELMGNFAKNMLMLLDAPLSELKILAQTEIPQSRKKTHEKPIDGDEFQGKSAFTCLYLTGENTIQPNDQVLKTVAQNCWENRSEIAAFVSTNPNI